MLLLKIKIGSTYCGSLFYRKGTHFRRANYEAENHEDLTEIIKDMSKGIGGWDSFEGEGRVRMGKLK